MSEERTRKTLEGVSADLLRADGAGYQTFDATEKRILRRVLIALLRQDMTTTGTTGIADNAATLEPAAALEPATTRAEPEEDKRFALIEIGEREP